MNADLDVFEDRQGRRPRFETVHFASRADQHLCCLQARITPVNHTALIIVRSGINGTGYNLDRRPIYAEPPPDDPRMKWHKWADLAVTHPRELARLSERIGLKPDEVEEWLTRAEQIRLPAQNHDGVIEQFDGYFGLESLPVAHAPECAGRHHSAHTTVAPRGQHAAGRPDRCLVRGTPEPASWSIRGTGRLLGCWPTRLSPLSRRGYALIQVSLPFR